MQGTLGKADMTSGAGERGATGSGLFTGPARVCEGEVSVKRGTTAELQGELAKVNAAFVSAVCDHRETKAALLHKVKVLQGDLHTAKQTCKDQEYHMQKKEQEYQASSVASEKSGGGANERAAWEREKTAWATEKTEQTRENEGLRKRVRELEVVEIGWKQVRGIFTTERMAFAGN
jgi:translation initiation factor 2 beta subunit (eIF-2beta)/eIF-5